VIRQALNRTQTALSSLFDSIELKMRRSPTRDANQRRRGEPHVVQSSANRSHHEQRRKTDVELSGIVEAVELCADLASAVLPVVAALFAVRAAYTSYYACIVDEDRHQTIADRLWIDVGTTMTASSRRCRRKNASTTSSAAELRRGIDHSSVFFFFLL